MKGFVDYTFFKDLFEFSSFGQLSEPNCFILLENVSFIVLRVSDTIFHEFFKHH